VHGEGDALLARAALSLDEDRRLRSGDRAHALDHLAHRLGAPHDEVRGFGRSQTLAQRAILLLEGAHARESCDALHDRLVAEWLLDVGGRAGHARKRIETRSVTADHGVLADEPAGRL
jgi:hypothetical protein